MKKLFVPVALALLCVSVSSCDFFRALAGRPTSAELASSCDSCATPCEGHSCCKAAVVEIDSCANACCKEAAADSCAHKCCHADSAAHSCCMRAAADSCAGACQMCAENIVEVALANADSIVATAFETADSLVAASFAAAETMLATGNVAAAEAMMNEAAEAAEAAMNEAVAAAESAMADACCAASECVKEDVVELECEGPAMQSKSLSVVFAYNKPFAKNVTKLENKYYILIGTFKNASNVIAQRARADAAGYPTVLIKYSNGLTAVAVCPTDDLLESITKLTEVRKKSFCPADACILVAE